MDFKKDMNRNRNKKNVIAKTILKTASHQEDEAVGLSCSEGRVEINRVSLSPK